MTPDERDRSDPPAPEVRARRVMALLLGAFVILVFAITIAKIQAGMQH